MIYVTSDWHGCPMEVIRELFSQAHFSDKDFCFVLGDVIDRGDNGVKLLEWLMVQPNIELILGNHEKMMLDCAFLFDEINDASINRLTERKISAASNWMYNGASPTIRDLKIMTRDKLRCVYEYLEEAPLYECVDIVGRSFILTHSGLGYFSPEKEMTDYTESELIWTRPKLEDEYFSDILTVFGHTPTAFFGQQYKGKMIRTKTWVDIDTGAAMGLTPMLLRLDDMKEFY